MAFSLNEIKRNYKRRQNEKGLCRDCPNKKVPGHCYCQYHLEENRKRNIKRGKLRARNGICKNCGTPLGSDEVKEGRTCHPRSDCKPYRRSIR